jgi:anti-sigma regulatory factor (Ser/Thr protein kinase)/CheY-like chemotaxis protein
MPNPNAALIVNASAEVADLVSSVFSAAQWQVVFVPDNETAFRLIQQKRFGVILTGENTRATADIDLLRQMRRVHPHTRMIILTDRLAPEDVIAAIRESAFSVISSHSAIYHLKEMLENAIGAPPWDDGIDLLSATPAWIRLYARCDLTTANRLVHFLNEICGDLPEDEREQVSLAFREMLTNAIEHGGGLDPNHYVEISYLRSRRAVSCRIKDPGEGFSFDKIPHSALSNPPDDPTAHLTHRADRDLRPGGFGILMARELVDELIHNEAGNEVVLIKYLDSGRP